MPSDALSESSRDRIGRTRTLPRARRERWIDAATVLLLARRELRDALRNRWFLLYAVCFAVVSLALAYLALVGTGSYGLAGFGRTAASLINLVLLIVPLMGLTAGAGALAGERERGTLETLLTHPVSRTEILLGKYLGAATALLGALALGFGTSGLVMGLKGGLSDVGRYATLFAYSVLLAWAMLSVGFLISSAARKTAVASAVAIFTWLVLVFFSDLALMGSTIAFRLQAAELFTLAMLNPLQAFKLAAIGQLHASLDLLGPAGLYATRRFGKALPLLLSGALVAWLVVPLLLSCLIFGRRSVR